jgi:putative FmdB family regulatory protein
MPIYEFACPNCRVVFNFLSKRVNPERLPVCPRCGNRKMVKQLSVFATPRRSEEPATASAGSEAAADLDDPRRLRAIAELEQQMGHLDEHNPKHMAQIMKRMREVMPPGAFPKDIDTAIRRLEAGEDPEKIEADMGDVFGEMTNATDEEESLTGFKGQEGYSRDSGLYEY